jgi:cyclophilin family peptidyl-prolyl cis-trans isomerase
MSGAKNRILRFARRGESANVVRMRWNQPRTLSFFRLALAALALSLVGPLRAGDSSLPDGLYVEFITPRGPIICELYYQKVPLPVTGFVGLAEGTLAQRGGRPFYSGLKWYRVVPNFVVQSGDPTFAPNKADDAEGHPFSFPDVFVPGLHHDAAGVLSMANAGPDTNSSEFFITLRDTQRLNYLHSVFGRIVRGLDALHALKQNDPITAVQIVRVGEAAREFKADKATFDALVAEAKKYEGATEPGPEANFDDPDHLLPTDPPRAKNFNFKLSNYDRATGRKVCARVYAKFAPEEIGQKAEAFAAALADRLGLDEDGVLAVYFADRDDWTLWLGERATSAFVGKAAPAKQLAEDGSLAKARQEFLGAARKLTGRYIAEAEEANPGQTILRAQKIKFATDAVLDGLLLRLEPKPGTEGNH